LGGVLVGLRGLMGLGVLGNRAGGRAEEDEKGAQAKGAQGRSKSIFHGLLQSVCWRAVWALIKADT
jgi:hypothetical protein